jgi:hypothetical protein
MLYGQTPKWIDRLERLMPGLGIPNLALYLIGAQAFGFLVILAEPRAWQLLVLDPDMVVRGELWRLVTFMAMPLSISPLWMLFALYFLYFVINGIEEEWGEFRTTLYVLVGVVLTIAFSFTFDFPIWSVRELQSTLFLAAATIAPDYQIMIWFVLPVKMKWLAWISVVFIIWEFVNSAWLGRLYLLVMYANYLLFFGPYFISRVQAFYRRRKFQRDVAAGRTIEDETRE